MECIERDVLVAGSGAGGFAAAVAARFNSEGFRNVLALRAEMEGEWGGTPPASERYVDLGYYERALKRLGR